MSVMVYTGLVRVSAATLDMHLFIYFLSLLLVI